ncbi:hypothetical protein TYRP_007735 [Tyrophagus putrescentiae]|nr:hypothetical protein TYRP_007735 [Tyrophagus putrescentiae]
MAEEKLFVRHFWETTFFSRRLTEGEQSVGIIGEQMHLKVGVVSGISLEGTQKSAQAVRFEDHCLQLSENGQVGNFNLQSSQTVDGGDQLSSQCPVYQICSVHHQVGQLTLPVGMLQKGDQSFNVLAVFDHHEL